MYKLLFHPRAVKKLKRLQPSDKKRVLEKLDSLSHNPRSKSLDTRKLAKTKRSFRMRAGNLRAIFEIEEQTKTIYIWDVDYRGSMY